MSLKSKRVFRCQKCQHEFEIETYDSINVKEDEDLKYRVISGDIFHYECPKCHVNFMINYDCLYHDPDKKFMVFHSATKLPALADDVYDKLSMKGYKLRYCDTLGSFVEKIQILDEGLDDRAVEYAKYDSFIDYTQNRGDASDVTGIYYQGFENDVLKIKIELDDKALTTMIPYYGLMDEMDKHEDLFSVDNKKFVKVDPSWIISIFQRFEQ